jgi:DnaA family protein
VPEQLIFELAGPVPPTFATFVPGRNVEAVETLARIARHEARETGVVLWGVPGGGKTHLLRAAVDEATRAGRAARFIAAPDTLRDEPTAAEALVAIDAVDAADATAQARLFTLYNELASCDGQLVVASDVPPARMSLRDDIRTRLGWGLVFEVLPLADNEKPSALAAYAHARGFSLSQDVIDYLLAHGRRDMPSLVATLSALDRHSLALRRPITVPLVREWLQHDIRWPDRR